MYCLWLCMVMYCVWLWLCMVSGFAFHVGFIVFFFSFFFPVPGLMDAGFTVFFFPFFLPPRR